MMKKILIICLLGLCSCSSDSTEEVNTGGIAGSVSDQTTGDPVATVNVTLSPSGKSTVTGSDGSFSFVDLEPDDYTIDIRKEGYNPNSNRIRVTAGQQSQAHLLIERIPAIVTADRKELDFGENVGVNTLSFGIVNSSYEDLSWQIEHDCRWIKEIRPVSGVLKLGKTETIVVIIDRELLSAGNNETVLVVRSTNGRAEVKIKAVGAERDTPRLNILDATEITSSTATLNGEVLAAGIPAYTERGFVYSLNSMPTFDNMLAKLTAPVTEDNTYSYNLRGLTLGETYYVRAYATNSVGTAYSANEIDFTTIASSPELTVQEVTDMNASKASATFNGVVVNVGDPAYFERGFVYSTDSNPTINNTKIKANGTSEGAFSANISGLQLNQRYYVRTYAISKINDSEQVTYSKEEISFTLASVVPEVQTLQVTNTSITNGSAVFNGVIISEGEPKYAEKGFVYSKLINPNVNDAKLLVAGEGIGEYSLNVDGLQEGYEYYIRAYVVHLGDVIYGDNVRFNFSAVAPIVQTLYPINVNSTSIAIYGQLISAGDPILTEKGFICSTLPNPSLEDVGIMRYPVFGTSIGTYMMNISGLSTDQQYYIRAYATNEKQQAYGDVMRIKVEEPQYAFAGDNLLVQKIDISTSDINWESANYACQGSAVGGFNDWRLPTIEELVVLYQNKSDIGGFAQDKIIEEYVDGSVTNIGGINYHKSYYNKVYKQYYYWSNSLPYYSMLSFTTAKVDQYKNSTDSYYEYYRGSYGPNKGTSQNYEFYYRDVKTYNFRARCVRSLNPTTTNQ